MISQLLGLLWHKAFYKCHGGDITITPVVMALWRKAFYKCNVNFYSSAVVQVYCHLLFFASLLPVLRNYLKHMLHCLSVLLSYCLQCFDAVGWVAGRASSL